jgi:hypothetical protein
VRGTAVLMIFFLMFTTASILAPFPMFPGNFLCLTIGPAVQEYSLYLSAAFNGFFYGILVWLLFVGLSRKLEQENQ